MDIDLKKHIKAFSAICSLAMVFTMFTAVVSADDGTIELNQAYVDSHAGHLPTETGNYVLSENINVSTSAQITTTGVNVTIDLNGKTITYTRDDGVEIKESLYKLGKASYNSKTGIVTVADNIHLTINDSSSEKTGLITTGEGYAGGGSTDNWISNDKNNPDAATAGRDDGRGGCVLIEYNSTFTLNGGTISGFYAADEGGAVHVGNGAHFLMTGGTIRDCSAKRGGAVTVHKASRCETSTDSANHTFYLIGDARIEGGTITNNYATFGGGVRVLRGQLHLSNCVITGNSCDTNSTDTNGGGGGVQIITARDGKSGGTLTMGGNVQIYGNTSRKNEVLSSNLFFVDEIRPFTLTSDLDENANIIFGSKTWDQSKAFFNANGKSFNLDSFVCASDTYHARYNSTSDAIMVTNKIDPKIEGCYVGVAGRILLNTRVSLGSYDDNNASVTYSYEYTKTGKSAKTVTNTLSRSQMTSKGNGVYEFAIPVESACMTAPIEITITYGTAQDSISKSVTIEAYAKSIMENADNEYSEAEEAAAKALLIYGGYAQVQLGINADQLPTVSGVDFHSTFANALTAETYTSPVTGYAASALSLLSETEIKMYFSKATLGDTAPSMTVNYGSSSETVTATTSGNYYVYTIKGPSGSGFAATQFDSEFTYTIGNESGTYSVYTYLKLAKAKGAADLINLAEAYYNFAQQCKLVA